MFLFRHNLLMLPVQFLNIDKSARLENILSFNLGTEPEQSEAKQLYKVIKTVIFNSFKFYFAFLNQNLLESQRNVSNFMCTSIIRIVVSNYIKLFNYSRRHTFYKTCYRRNFMKDENF